jgi:hypothetical protein
MTKTSKPSQKSAKRRPQTLDRTAISEAQLDAARGGDGASPSLYGGCAGGVHYPH